ncbi:MAG: hypothetical protein C4527_10885 [Candidatus Omnitrophota bacterium]|nr:MAG: hypothetical protein C4527_10885 [Candidatus Omnitrophota bacterium]
MMLKSEMDFVIPLVSMCCSEWFISVVLVMNGHRFRPDCDASMFVILDYENSTDPISISGNRISSILFSYRHPLNLFPPLHRRRGIPAIAVAVRPGESVNVRVRRFLYTVFQGRIVRRS